MLLSRAPPERFAGDEGKHYSDIFSGSPLRGVTALASQNHNHQSPKHRRDLFQKLFVMQVCRHTRHFGRISCGGFNQDHFSQPGQRANAEDEFSIN